MNRTRLFSAVSIVTLTALVAPAHAINGPFNATYQAGKLDLDDIIGRAEITVGGSDISVAVTGDPQELSAVEVSLKDGRVTIRDTRPRHDIHDIHDVAKVALYKIRVPQGTSLAIDGMIGEIEAGDLGGELDVDAGALKGKVGAMKSVHLDGSGALTLTIGDVAGELLVDGSGAANIKTGNVDSAKLDLSGAGAIDIQNVRHGLDADIAGASHVSAQSVNGPVSVEVSGVGNVNIAAGKANPLRVDISGFGSFSFGGEGVDPDLTVSGMGGVTLKSYSGKLHTEGGNIHIGG